MKKRILLFFGLIFMAASIAEAQFNYTTNNGAITITLYTGSGGIVTVPDTINGFPVTTIGDSAFASTSVGSAHHYDGVIVHGEHQFTGWPESLNHTCTTASQYLTGLVDN